MLVEQIVRFLENLRDRHWYMFLVQDMELWEVLLMVSQMDNFLSSLRVKLW